MIYIETGSTDVCYDFALEYYFTLEKRLSDTVFLFWRTTPTLMVGKYQNVLEEVDKPYAEAHGIRIVRRMSGGGTIYTDLGGWQFSFIQHRETGEIEFSQYIMPVLEALEEMGVHAAFNGRNDLTIQGRKFSGNAQYRLGGCIVHHGPQALWRPQRPWTATRSSPRGSSPFGTGSPTLQSICRLPWIRRRSKNASWSIYWETAPFIR